MEKKIKQTVYIRWILTLVLLFIVFMNSHWSVALVLFLMSVRSEAIDSF